MENTADFSTSFDGAILDAVNQIELDYVAENQRKTPLRNSSPVESLFDSPLLESTPLDTALNSKNVVDKNALKREKQNLYELLVDSDNEESPKNKGLKSNDEPKTRVAKSPVLSNYAQQNVPKTSASVEKVDTRSGSQENDETNFSKKPSPVPRRKKSPALGQKNMANLSVRGSQGLKGGKKWNSQNQSQTQSQNRSQNQESQGFDSLEGSRLEYSFIRPPDSDDATLLSNWSLPESVLNKYTEKGITSMFEWQAECLSLPNVLDGGNLVYSAPTSAGKTMVAEILMLKRVLDSKKRALMILPFVSVAREKMNYLQSLFQDAGLVVDGFMGNHNPAGGLKHVHVAICTIEKANSLINRLIEEKNLDMIGCIVIDELHMIGDAHRGYLLELLLTKVLYLSSKPRDDVDKGPSVQIVGMSATLPNLDSLASWLKADLYRTDYRPVPLTECIKVGATVYSNQLKKMRDLDVSRSFAGDEDHVLPLCLETITAGHSVLIFCPSKAWCEKLAETIAREFYKINAQALHAVQDAAPELLSRHFLLDQIEDVYEQLRRTPVGVDQVLRRTVPYGVAFHHAGLTFDERDIVEGGFRQGAIRVLVATSTLSSGVNLPARRVIVRTPVFYGRVLDILTYKQMIGRAGRKGVDTEGESILMCKETEKVKAVSLVRSDLSPVTSCLIKDGTVSSSLKRAILEVVVSGAAQTRAEVECYASCTLLASSLPEQDKHNQAVAECIQFMEENELIILPEGGECRYQASQLGSAILASSLSPDEGLTVFSELRRARQSFVLDTELHLLYQVTPIYVSCMWSDVDWCEYLFVYEALPACMRRVADLVGVEEAFLNKAVTGRLLKSTPAQRRKLAVHLRFYTSLVLQDLVQEIPVSHVASKYKSNRGQLQSLQQAAATFAGMVTVFCNRLGWYNLELLMSQFQARLTFGVQRELCDLVRVSLLNGLRARHLYNAGITSLAALSTADPGLVESLLRKALPFQSKKAGDGESAQDVNQRVKRHCIHRTGQPGLTESQAAQMIIQEARQILEHDLGLPPGQLQNDDVTRTMTSVASPTMTSTVTSTVTSSATSTVTSAVTLSDAVAAASPPILASSITNVQKSVSAAPSVTSSVTSSVRMPMMTSKVVTPSCKLTVVTKSDVKSNCVSMVTARQPMALSTAASPGSSHHAKNSEVSMATNAAVFEKGESTIAVSKATNVNVAVCVGIDSIGADTMATSTTGASKVRSTSENISVTLAQVNGTETSRQKNEKGIDKVARVPLSVVVDSNKVAASPSGLEKRSSEDTDNGVEIGNTPTRTFSAPKPIVDIGESLEDIIAMDTEESSLKKPESGLDTDTQDPNFTLTPPSITQFDNENNLTSDENDVGDFDDSLVLDSQLEKMIGGQSANQTLASKSRSVIGQSNGATSNTTYVIGSAIRSTFISTNQKRSSMISESKKLIPDDEMPRTNQKRSSMISESKKLIPDDEMPLTNQKRSSMISESKKLIPDDKLPQSQESENSTFDDDMDQFMQNYCTQNQSNHLAKTATKRRSVMSADCDKGPLLDDSLPRDSEDLFGDDNEVNQLSQSESEAMNLNLRLGTEDSEPVDSSVNLKSENVNLGLETKISNHFSDCSKASRVTDDSWTINKPIGVSDYTGLDQDLAAAQLLSDSTTFNVPGDVTSRNDVTVRNDDVMTAGEEEISPHAVAWDVLTESDDRRRPPPRAAKRQPSCSPSLIKKKPRIDQNDKPPPRISPSTSQKPHASKSNDFAKPVSRAKSKTDVTKPRQGFAKSVPLAVDENINTIPQSELPDDVINISNDVMNTSDDVIPATPPTPTLTSTSSGSRSRRDRSNASRVGTRSTQTFSDLVWADLDSFDGGKCLGREWRLTRICEANQDWFFAEWLERREFSLAVACETAPSGGKKERELVCEGLLVSGLAVMWADHHVYYVPVDRNNLPLIRSILESDDVTIALYDVRRQYQLLARACAVHVALGACRDPLVAYWLLDPGAKERNLQGLVGEYMPLSVQDLRGLCSQGCCQPCLHLSFAVRACVEATLVRRLGTILNGKLAEKGLVESFTKTEMPALVTIARMELNGIGLDERSCRDQLSALQSRLAELERQCCHLAGRDFNLASTKHVQQVLFVELRLPVTGEEVDVKVAPSGRGSRTSARGKVKRFSTKQNILVKLKDRHPLPGLILEWRKISNTIKQVVQPLLCASERCRPLAMDRLYCQTQFHTATGRVIITEPSLQMIPKTYCISGDQTINIRRAIIASPGRVLVAADYSQLELRMLAHLARDPRLLQALNSGRDVFVQMAAYWRSKSTSQVSDTERQHAKQICYGMVYGVGAKSLAEQLEVTEELAEQFMESFKAKYSGIRAFQRDVVKQCRHHGYVTTLLGRRRYLPAINSTNPHHRAHAERQSVNTSVQGSAADLVKTAQIHIDNQLSRVFPDSRHTLRSGGSAPKSRRGADFVLQVHDELVYDVTVDDVRRVCDVIKQEMENCVQLPVKFPVKIKTGKSWGEMEEYVFREEP